MNETLGDASRAMQQTVYEFARASAIEGWWWWALLIASLALLVYGCVRFYRRDTVELSRPVSGTLVVLRLVTLAALVFFFFDFQRRTQREITRPSEVVVLVDTSQSMSLAETDAAGARSRAQRATSLIADSDLPDRLSREHRVSVYAFGESSEPMLLETQGEGLPGDAADRETTGSTDASDERSGGPQLVSLIALAGLITVGLGIVLTIASLLVGGLTETPPNQGLASPKHRRLGWLLAATAACWCLGILLTGGAYSVATSHSLASLVGLEPPPAADASGQQKSAAEDEEENDEGTPIKVLDWDAAIAASASQSRIGDAIKSVLLSHDPTTLAGIVLISDGQNNGGANVPAALASARRNEVALYPLGLGSSNPPTNVRVVDLDAPKRVYPDDKFAVSAVLQGNGGEPLEVKIQLLDGLEAGTPDGGDSDELPSEVIDSKTVQLAGDGSLSGVKFELDPRSVGRRRLAIRALPPANDQNANDDVRQARYEVVARKLKVMTVAGGPTREYRFVRNLLYREKSVELHTWLQTGQPGMSQDADELLTEFPASAAELFEYDAIVMFDPDWTALSVESLELLDRWLASQAGGLVIVGGPVYHPRWLRLRTDPRVTTIAGFFPVTFSSRGLMMGSGRDGGDTAWPLDFTTEAQRAEFLWVTDEPASSFEAWDSFGGVYDYVGVKSAKPAAKVYAYFSDPTTEISDTLPVYLASQFYGAGRVYFQGSGEMWRMRRESDAYFNAYYTKLVRWVSEGRLLRDSNRGVLLVDNSRAMVGDTITVRAVLTDEQFEPLAVPEVQAKLLSPEGRISDVRLRPLEGEGKPGTYRGRFVVREDGNYELRLTLGDALDEELLRQSVQVRLPTIELERPKRNDDELLAMATMTGGEYYPLDAEVSGDAVAAELSETILPQPQTTVLPGTPDAAFTLRRNATLMWLLASVLTMEWVVRRLHRLA